MRIGMLAPISWPVPPTGYGPWEQVVYNLTEGLIALGHDVTLFAAGGSESSAHIISPVPHALNAWPEAESARPQAFDPATGLLEGPPDGRVLETRHIAACMEMAADDAFDIVHSHLHVHALPYARLIPCPLVSSLHGAAWVRAAHPLFLEYREQPFVSLSNAERRLCPELNYVATVHNGILLEDFPLETAKEDYLLFAGRLSPEKGIAEAVQVSLQTGRPLKIAGMIEGQHHDYYERTVAPHLDGKQIEYLGLLDQRTLAEYYRKAAAVLFLIDWCEPCSMVGIEAQASGTPLIGTRYGYLPEIIRDGTTGFLVDDVEECCRALDRLDAIDPAACHANVVERFSAETMADGYERVYESLLDPPYA